jgi:hypothetical protein
VLLKSGSGRALVLSSFADIRLRNIEIGGDVRGAELQLHEVQAIDLCIGLTDGTIDNMVIPASVTDTCGVVSLHEDPHVWMQRCLATISKLARNGDIEQQTKP